MFFFSFRFVLKVLNGRYEESIFIQSFLFNFLEDFAGKKKHFLDFFWFFSMTNETNLESSFSIIFNVKKMSFLKKNLGQMRFTQMSLGLFLNDVTQDWKCLTSLPSCQRMSYFVTHKRLSYNNIKLPLEALLSRKNTNLSNMFFVNFKIKHPIVVKKYFYFLSSS